MIAVDPDEGNYAAEPDYCGRFARFPPKLEALEESFLLRHHCARILGQELAAVDLARRLGCTWVALYAAKAR